MDNQGSSPAEQKSKPHFDISAYAVKQLGDELISDEVTALMELVKNSYDADADYVNIVIDTDGTLTGYALEYPDHKGYILIDDNGDGMTKNDIEKGWLTISISKKREMKAKGQLTNKGRAPLGEKGLGRLSTQRLASKMEVITKNEGEPSAFHVYFDWNDFKEETLLSDVKVEIKPLEKESTSKGTRLILLNIKDKGVWLGESADKIKGKLSQLIFPKKRKRPFAIYLTINGKPFDLDFIAGNLKELAVSRYSYTFYRQCLTILGSIRLSKLKGNDRPNYTHLIESDNGKGFYNYISNPTNKKGYISSKFTYRGTKGIFIDFKITKLLSDISGKIVQKNEDETEVFVDPGNFRGKIDEYNFTKDTVDISEFAEIFNEFSKYTTYVQSQVGIRVFRDGFGIRPFGLDGEDWLKLNQEQTSGSSFYGIRPGNVIGFIQIGARSNPYLHEKTDREGLIDNTFFKNFYTINKKAVSEINALLEDIKRSYNEYRKQFGIDKTGLKNQADVFNLMKKTGEDAKILIDQVKELDAGISIVHNAVKNEIRLASEEPLFTPPESNKVQNLLKNVEEQLSQSKLLIERIGTLLGNASKLNEAVHLLEPQMKALQDQLAEFSQLAGSGIIAESLSHEIDNALDNLAQKSRGVSKYLRDKKNVDATLYTFIEYVNSITNSLRKQASHLSPVLKYLREEKYQTSVVNFGNELKEFYGDRLSKNNISLVVENDGDFSISINKGRLIQIFDNIILNSEYWLIEYLKTKKISPVIILKIKSPIVQIFDNGQGVETAVEDRIFQPFITSKPKKLGRGLGLFIVQQLLDVSDCDIVLLPQRNSLGRRFIFQINFTSILQ